MFNRWCSEEEVRAAEWCVEQHSAWIAIAKAAVECWNAVARRLGVSKDIRLLTARILWAERAEWSKIDLQKAEK